LLQNQNHPPEVRAANIALQAVGRKPQGGQRTTVDVMNSQQDLIPATARLIGALRNRASQFLGRVFGIQRFLIHNRYNPNPPASSISGIASALARAAERLKSHATKTVLISDKLARLPSASKIGGFPDPNMMASAYPRKERVR
jgi:hypothetical protein